MIKSNEIEINIVGESRKIRIKDISLRIIVDGDTDTTDIIRVGEARKFKVITTLERSVESGYEACATYIVKYTYIDESGNVVEHGELGRYDRCIKYGNVGVFEFTNTFYSIGEYQIFIDAPDYMEVRKID